MVTYKKLKSEKMPEMPAAFWKRAVAYLVDTLVINIIIIYPFKSLLNFGEGKSFTELYAFFTASPGTMYNLLLVFVSILIMTMLYWGIFESRFSQSIGKMLMRISVSSKNSEKVSFKQAITRNLSKMSTLLLGIEVIYMLYKKSNQRYLEFVSETEVIEGIK